MTVEAWRAQAIARLERAGDLDAQADADWMLCEALSIGRARLRMMADHPVEEEKMEKWLARREAGEPLQYVLGNTSFMGLTLKCDKRALIPRFDTETVCEAALVCIEGKRAPRVLDMCTGSGALGLAIAHFRPDAQVTLSDISEDALALARENADLLGVRADFRQGDLFETVAGEQFDLIVCNPPYIREEDAETLMREVAQFEPALALFGGPDGYDFYRRIAREMPRHLAAGGMAVLEVGMGQAEEVAALLAGSGDSHLHKDLGGIARAVVFRLRDMPK